MKPTKGFIIPSFIVFVISLSLYEMPLFSYIIAWLGSFYIFYLTWFSRHRTLQNDLPIAAQIMRPIFLIQLIFAGFMACTSIFYFLDQLGYEYFEKVEADKFVPLEHSYQIAKCQRLSLLAHISLVWGILWQQGRSNNKKKYSFNIPKQETNYQWLRLGIVFYGLAILFQFIDGLFQFSIYFNNLAVFCASLLLLNGLKKKEGLLLIYGATIFILNFINATLSGFKEHILINVIILFALLYPFYKRTIALISIPTVYILLYVLPTYAMIIRQQSWTGDKSASEARSAAFETIFQEKNEDQIVETNWFFLTDRFSEISMFTQFVDYIPEQRDYYRWEILENSLLALVPRAFYPAKPITEKLSMQRVYEAGVIDERSTVSAKTRPVVDAYLSFGYTGVFIAMLILGTLTQWLNNTAERWFGGYEFGCIVIFNGCFQVLWRGNNFEFMLNNMVYGFLTMWLVFIVLRKMEILVPKAN